MRHNPNYAVDDEAFVRELIAANPWATIVSQGQGGLVASHYPVLLDEGRPGLAVLSHVGRPDEKLHGLGERELLMIIAGPHGYISPSWYGPEATHVPTWNFTVAHCYGTPEVLSQEENLRVLGRLVDHFERHVEEPMALGADGARIVSGTVGIRLPIERFICKLKMNQEEDPLSRRQVLAALRKPGGPYANPQLADAMEAALGRPSCAGQDS